MFAGAAKFFSNVKSYYNEINSATLTGAIDVVVVEQPDGTYQSSPFHVRFGKLGVIRSNEKVVYIEINGEPTELQMKLGPAGEAFFVQGVQEQWEGPEYMATSPIPTSPISQAMALRPSKSDSMLESKQTSSCEERRLRRDTAQSSCSSSASDLSSKDKTFAFKPISQEEDELLESGGMFEIEVDEGEAPVPNISSSMSKTVSLPIVHESSMIRTESWAINSYHKQSHFHPFSDTDITPLVSPVGSRPPTPKSDTECEYVDRKGNVASDSEELQQWNWGELPDSSQIVTQHTDDPETEDMTQNPQEESKGMWSFMRRTKTIRHKPEEGGIYLDDINLQEMEPEVAALYFPKKSQQKLSKTTISKSHVIDMPDDDVESGNGQSLPHSPDLTENVRNLSTPTSETGTMRDNDSGIYGDVMMSLCGGVIESYSAVSEEIFDNHRVDYQTFVKKPTEILQNDNLVVRISGKYYNWATAAPMIMCMMCYHQTLSEETQENLTKAMISKKAKLSGRSSWWPLPFGRSRGSTADLESSNSTPNGSPKKSTPVSQTLPSRADKHSESGDDADDEKEKLSTLEPLTVETNTNTLTVSDDANDKHYVKALRLTSEELHKLNLHEGENEIEFSVTTAFQGTTRCFAKIYLWKHTDKVIISDIDGTITKSDVLGQLLPLFGKEYAHSGVTDLFTKIAANGYKFAYLSARAIGQAQVTRDYLKSVRQGKSVLPPGPMLLNPSSLINAFHKEVIEKKPEEFKIRCLRDIKSLFSSKEALCAGFGNRVNDLIAYRAVGIPKSRMFLIDTTGKVKSDFTETFQTSYCLLSSVTDHYFPPLHEEEGESEFHAPAQYSNFTYWREPVPDVPLTLPD